MAKKGFTEIQKEMLLKLKQTELAQGFETDFIMSLTNSCEKGWAPSVAQAQALSDMFDRKILGNTEEKVEFKFGLITIKRNDHNKMWKIFIENREIDEPFMRKDALIISNFLNDHFPGICMDLKMEPEIIERFLDSMDGTQETIPPITEEQQEHDEDNENPF